MTGFDQRSVKTLMFCSFCSLIMIIRFSEIQNYVHIIHILFYFLMKHITMNLFKIYNIIIEHFLNTYYWLKYPLSLINSSRQNFTVCCAILITEITAINNNILILFKKVVIESSSNGQLLKQCTNIWSANHGLNAAIYRFCKH